MSGDAPADVDIPLTNSADKIRRIAVARAIGPPILFAPESDGDTHLMLGDMVTGVIEAARSDRQKTTCLAGRRRDRQYFDTQLELGQVGPGVPPGGIQLNPNKLRNLPTLGGLTLSIRRRTQRPFADGGFRLFYSVGF